MAVAAESQVKVIPELASDEAVRHRAANFIGSVALGNCVEAPTNVQPIESLYHAIQVTEAGNQQARKMIETNARTDVIERTMKAGHVMSVNLMVDEAGKIRQYGQSMDSVQANSLRFASGNQQMRERTEAETRNAFRMEHHYQTGELETHNFVVFSRAADNMTETDAKQAGFFTDTMSCAIQVTGAQGTQLVTESAFVAGIAEAGARRHDEAMIARVGKHFGIDFTGKSATELLDTPLLIPKELMPNGVIDLVALADAAHGTFFGQAKPAQDYVDYLRVCAEREQRFETKVQAITEELIAEARSITSPQMAAQRLHQISERHMVQQAIGDDDIDPRVFGPAARDIENARAAYYQGQPEDVMRYLQSALQNAQSSSCPGGGGTAADNSETTANTPNTLSTETCSFTSKECPICHKKNVKTTITATHIRGDCGCSKAK